MKHINIFKNIILFFFAILFTSQTKAQTETKNVSITASGSGITLEDAQQAALRSATEQAFGVFISSKIEMLNNKIVADEMASVTSGNIKSFEILNKAQLPDGRWDVILNAIVSIDKLTSFVQSKGVKVEVNGGLFAVNIKQQIINENGEINAICNMIGILHEAMQVSFNYDIKSGEPISTDGENKNWQIPITVVATANNNMDFCANYFIKTLTSICLTSADRENYRALNKQSYQINISYNGNTNCFYLRKKKSLDALNSFISNWIFYTRLFNVKSFKEYNGVGTGIIHDFGNNDLGNNQIGKIININFLKSGNVAATFNWNDFLTLDQIEKVTNYKITPRGIVSFFRHGGYVLSDNGRSGLVASIFDIGSYSWDDAKVACEELELNSYSDWHLPSKEELKCFYYDFFKKIYLDKQHLTMYYFYWSASEA